MLGTSNVKNTLNSYRHLFLRGRTIPYIGELRNNDLTPPSLVSNLGIHKCFVECRQSSGVSMYDLVPLTIGEVTTTVAFVYYTYSGPHVIVQNQPPTRVNVAEEAWVYVISVSSDYLRKTIQRSLVNHWATRKMDRLQYEAFLDIWENYLSFYRVLARNETHP